MQGDGLKMDEISAKLKYQSRMMNPSSPSISQIRVLKKEVDFLTEANQILEGDMDSSESLAKIEENNVRLEQIIDQLEKFQQRIYRSKLRVV